MQIFGPLPRPYWVKICILTRSPGDLCALKCEEEHCCRDYTNCTLWLKWALMQCFPTREVTAIWGDDVLVHCSVGLSPALQDVLAPSPLNAHTELGLQGDHSYPHPPDALWGPELPRGTNPRSGMFLEVWTVCPTAGCLSLQVNPGGKEGQKLKHHNSPTQPQLGEGTSCRALALGWRVELEEGSRGDIGALWERQSCNCSPTSQTSWGSPPWSWQPWQHSRDKANKWQQFGIRELCLRWRRECIQVGEVPILCLVLPPSHLGWRRGIVRPFPEPLEYVVP